MDVPSDPKLDGFDVLQTTYKTVQGHGIRVDILIPKKPSKPGKHPVIVRFHGGAWVSCPPPFHTPLFTFHEIDMGLG